MRSPLSITISTSLSRLSIKYIKSLFDCLLCRVTVVSLLGPRQLSAELILVDDFRLTLVPHHLFLQLFNLASTNLLVSIFVEFHHSLDGSDLLIKSWWRVVLLFVELYHTLNRRDFLVNSWLHFLLFVVLVFTLTFRGIHLIYDTELGRAAVI